MDNNTSTNQKDDNLNPKQEERQETEDDNLSPKQEERREIKKRISKEDYPKKTNKWFVFLIIGAMSLLIGVACLLFVLLKPKAEVESLEFPKISTETASEGSYSLLTGEPLAKDANQNAPVFCIQTPNGMDGARPQVGLTEAGVVFEAIAEAGITRFAAIYQNPNSAIIGPIRSLRIYYLEWDTPFDCTIVHAGGSGDALAAVSSGGYRNFDENYQYMYRGTYGNRLWNNLFTTSANLKRFNADRGYNTSDPKGFKRLTPEESKKSRINKLVNEKLEITTPTKNDTSTLAAEVSSIRLRFGGFAGFNVNYEYDLGTNTYRRSYANGAEHEVYNCPAEDLGERNPEDVCSLTTLSPSVVVAMVVQEGLAADRYHEDIATIGSGSAYIFQNGSAVHGTWNKASRDDQIKFFDEAGNEVLLAPGQTFVSAIPNYGGVEY